MTLSAKQIAAINLLITGKTITHTAAAIGVNEKTIDRWFADSEDFAGSYEDRKAALLECGFLKAANHINEVLDVMISIMRDEDASNRDRISAGKALLSEVDRFEAIDNRLQMRELAISQQYIKVKEAQESKKK